jgi:perosamine synthetase
MHDIGTSAAAAAKTDDVMSRKPSELPRSDRINIAGPWVTQLEMDFVADAMANWYDKPYHYCEAFERAFADYHRRRFALMTPNCTSAIHLLLAGLGVGPGDEVIVPECTWIASAAPISYAKAVPVFCDVERRSWCLDPASVKQAIGPRTRAIVAVDLYGNMPSMAQLLELAAEHGIPLVEDSAEALGSTLNGRRAGSFGVGSVFSFHRTKTLTTGEGGMLLVDDEALYDRCRKLRDHGRGPQTPMYFNDVLGFKYMPFNVQAALGYAQFLRIDELVGRKRELLNMYRERLADLEDVQLNPEPEGGVNGAWITAALFGARYGVTTRDVIERMAAKGIPIRPFFYPLSSLPAYQSGPPFRKVATPVAEDIATRGINLPAAFTVTEQQVDTVCDGLKAVLRGSHE